MSFDIGINFRGSSAFVNDGANETYCLAESYPTTRLVGGLMVTFGWEDAPGGARDRNTSFDERLSGINFSTAAGTRFRLDLPAAGAVTVHCAAGDYSGGNAGNFDFKDGTTTLFGTTVTESSGGDFADAAGNVWFASAWPGSEVGRAVTLTGTALRVVARDANVNCLAHLRVVQATSPPPPPPGITDYVAGFQDAGITDYVASF